MQLSVALTGMVFFMTISIASAEETVLRLVAPGNPITNPTDELEISTSEIDSLVGNNQFSNNVNEFFTKINNMKQSLRADLISEILQNSNIIRVDELNFVLSPLAAELTSLHNSIHIEISGLNTIFAAKAEGGFPVICDSVNFSTDIESRAIGSFDFQSGILSDLSFHHAINVTNASCSGVLGFLGDVAADIFSGGVGGQVENAIENNLRQFLDIGSLQTIFSLDEFFINIRDILPDQTPVDKINIITNNISSGLSTVSGLQLTIKLFENFFSSNRHLITLIGAQEKPAVSALQVPVGTRIEIDDLSSAGIYRIYAKRPFSEEWFHFTNSTTSVFTGPLVTAGTSLKVVAVNSEFSDIISFPGRASVRRGGFRF